MIDIAADYGKTWQGHRGAARQRRGNACTVPRARHRGSSPTPATGRPFKARRWSNPRHGQFGTLAISAGEPDQSAENWLSL